jgi:MFS superfamily sulfate permease-like transporter
VAGVALSLALYLHRTSRPHIAEVGLVPGTEHFRNVQRHAVQTSPRVLSLRVDESLYFANARALEDRINDAGGRRPALRTWCCSARPSTTSTPARWRAWRRSTSACATPACVLHLSEVKGPVMDRLQDHTAAGAPARAGVPQPPRRAARPGPELRRLGPRGGRPRRSAQVVAVQVHHLGPGGAEVAHELRHRRHRFRHTPRPASAAASWSRRPGPPSWPST